MYQFFERYKLLIPTEKGGNNLNNLISIKAFIFVRNLLKIRKKRLSDPDHFKGELYKIFKE